MRSLKYNGSMVYDSINDSEIRANYQHKHVVDLFINNFKDKKVLDAGCWTGTMEKVVFNSRLNCQMVGIDQNKDALKVASKAFPKFKFFQIELDNPDQQFINKYRNYFDTVIFLDVIEHVPPGSEISILRFLQQMLKPGGSLVLSTMIDHHFNFIDPAWFLGHRHYKIRTIDSFLKKSGFMVKKLLRLGNLFWDIDILFLYIYKHIFKRGYKTSSWMYRQIYKGMDHPQKYATRIYALAQKPYGHKR